MTNLSRVFKIVLTSLWLIHAFAAKAATFGADDRVLISPYSLGYVLSRSTAVAVLNTLITETSSGVYALDVDSTSKFLCKDEKFSNQPSLSYACSGFLVAPDLLVTAGHCMTNFEEVIHETGKYCEAYSSWVFGYSIDNNQKAKTTGISEDDHYRCKQIIYAVADSNQDFALIQLDRPVKGRTPLNLSKAKVSGKEKLKMIGHPIGLPAVLSQNARIIENNKNSSSYRTTLDAFYGNSGSAVFNQYNQVVGILISGTPYINLIQDEKNKCERFNICDENTKNCSLEDNPKDFTHPLINGTVVQRLEPLLKKIEDFEKKRKLTPL